MVQAERSRKEREEERRRREILECAEPMFARLGYHGTSVADIAREAEFGIGTLYKYFKDKEGLFQSLIDMRMEEYHRKIDEAIFANDDPLDLLMNFIDAYIDLMFRRKDFFKLFFTLVHPSMDAPFFSGLDLEKYIGDRERIIGRLVEIYQEGVKAGTLAPLEPDYVVFSIYGIIISFYYLAEKKFGENWETEKMKDMLKKIVFEKISIDSPDGGR